MRNKTAAGGKKKKRGAGANAREQRDKKQRVKNADEVAGKRARAQVDLAVDCKSLAYETDDGEEEGREQDYMSDSGSDTRLLS